LPSSIWWPFGGPFPGKECDPLQSYASARRNLSRESLWLEALERLGREEPLRRAQEAVFSVLALESEQIGLKLLDLAAPCQHRKVSPPIRKVQRERVQ
jgi:hypothetical protein